jgi:CxxC motif-containing protein (DUF1111 family)
MLENAYKSPFMHKVRAMRKLPLHQKRKWFGIGLVSLLGIGVAWHFSPGLPVMFGPSASAKTKQAGYELFTHEWEPNDPMAHGDGVGPVFNAKSCVACHFQGGAGGGGGAAQNVHNYEVLPTQGDPNFRTGTIHSFAVDPSLQESFGQVRQRFPIVKGFTRTETRDHCSYTVNVPDVDPLRTESIQTTALFGAGWADRISDKAILSARRSKLWSGMVKEMSSDFDFESVGTGRPRILSGGRVGKFGWKAQFATLEEFVAAACSNELGLSTPLSDQAKPFSRPDYPETKKSDLDRRQFRQLVAFVETLPKPVEVLPASPGERDQAIRGKQLFAEIGCAVCHIPDLGGVKGIYTDFLLHRLDDGNPNVPGGNYGTPLPNQPPPPDDVPHPSEWKTPALWGAADSAPYMHDGGASTLDGAITRHGGDAKVVREAYRKLPREQQQALIAFLQTLKAPPDATPAPQPATVAKR